jgi:glucose/arabinose dehydrogenase
MKQRSSAFLFIACLVLLIWCCNTKSSSSTKLSSPDSLSVGKGEEVFEANCSGCHNFRFDGIGPKLGGLTASVTDAWIKNFIRNPKAVMDAGDTIARALLVGYPTVMPSFSLPDSQVHDLIAFLHTKKFHPTTFVSKNLTEITDPMPDTITRSALTCNLSTVTSIPASSLERPFTRINKIECHSGVMYILDMRGKLYAKTNKHPFVYLDLPAGEPSFLGKPGLATGFGSFAFHPDFKNNGLLYTTHTEPAHTKKADFSINDSIKTALQWVLTEWKASMPGASEFSGTHRELLRIDMVTGMHGVQEITFRPGAKRGEEDYGLLYVGVGDGGCVENGYPLITHQPGKVWGAILRIDPLGKNSGNGRYGIPVQNPFASDPKKCGEMFAYGFRNPNRISWSRSNLMLVSNIGQANIESVNIVNKGNDFGWPQREGPLVLDYEGDMRKVYALPSNDSVNHYTYPVLQYDHGEGSAISGGFEYTGSRVKQLKGKYIFGDVVSGKLFFTDTKELKPGHLATIREFNITNLHKRVTLKKLCGDARVDLRFGEDCNGEILILTKSDGMIYRLEN